jgi:hypothetical protein
MTILNDLQSIEQQLNQDGDTTEVRTAFWRIVGKIKRSSPNEVSDETIKKATKIRNQLFKHEVVLSVGSGLGIFFIITNLAFLSFLWTLFYFESMISMIIVLPPMLLLLLLNAVILLMTVLVVYGVYPWGRFFGGVIARVKFDGFYRYSPGELGLKIEYSSYLQTTQSRRKWVFGFPIILVFGFLLLLLFIAWFVNPAGIWAPLILVVGFGIFYLAIYYKKTGELYRFMREFRIERELKAKQKERVQTK